MIDLIQIHQKTFVLLNRQKTEDKYLNCFGSILQTIERNDSQIKKLIHSALRKYSQGFTLSTFGQNSTHNNIPRNGNMKMLFFFRFLQIY